ncbi:phage terminase small subunit P27 family [Enterococcus thailandicus]|uniref:phage terminase small subunit P27 family n=1 Tax=Enterococcus thailandicus TaxID=417368 RepID=UPI00244D8189|nr:phage terminase small subunit P27 family [Enterococcus thailandicus]GMC01789.1 terminase [Enterococcus thailandicus]
MPRPAKSARLQLIQKNPNKKNTKELKKRAEFEEKMQMKADEIRAPSWLDKRGKEVFEFIKKELLSIDLVMNPDIYSMAMYSDWYSQYVNLHKQYKKMQREYKKEYQKRKKQAEDSGNEFMEPSELYGNPLAKQMDTCSKNVRVFGSDLGLSPASRAKLAIKLAQDDGDDSEWT